MGDAVVLAKKSPYAVFVIWVAAIKLYGFQFGKLLNQRLVNDQPLIAVPSRRLVFVLADALLQKFGHLEMRIAKQGRYAHHRGKHLGKECSAAVANKQVGMLPVDD